MKTRRTRRELHTALTIARDGAAEWQSKAAHLRDLLEWCVGAVQAAINEIHDDHEDTIDACEKLIEIKEELGLPVHDEDRQQLAEAIHKRDEEEAAWARRRKK